MGMTMIHVAMRLYHSSSELAAVKLSLSVAAFQVKVVLCCLHNRLNLWGFETG